ncbi:MAG: hypothetical protein OEV40_27810, partial [Acidimicrobiia bacterium]|nr:hypothetical protein [Acidimicrobiia bacterium]
MGRRIEVELTSTREDGSWTWRAAGARQPKGELTGTLLYEGAQVGDVVKVEAEFHVDGIEVTEVFAPKKKKERSNLLELKSRPLRDDELVTTQRVGRDERRGGRRRSRDREPQRRGGEGRGGPRRERAPRPDNAEQRPKPKRLRPKRVHRDALLSEVGDEYRPIIEQVIKDGMPGVRAAIERQNAEAKEAGKPEIDAAPILAIAEKNLGRARLAEWRDRADAALAVVDELDLRDLRSVVVAGNDVARDDETRELAEKLKTSLDERVEADHGNWLQDLETAIDDGRVVRALRLSSRPVKAGAPLPPELATRLAGQASEALAPDVGQERWATVLDALAFSPVRGAVTPVGLPTEPKKELLDAVQRLADRIPTIAAEFGLDPAATPRSGRRRRSGRKDASRDQPRSRSARSDARSSKPDTSPAPATEHTDPDQAPTTEHTDPDQAPTTEHTDPDQAPT